MATWVDVSGMSSGNYYGHGWFADMGVYTGPWPFYWPPSVNPDGFGGEVDFLVMLPNPADPTDLTILGDGSYDTYVYATQLFYPGTTWLDTDWYNDYLGPTLTSVPLPPVLQSGAHLYVWVNNGSGAPPSFTPESLVPTTYGGANSQEWSPGGWSSLQPSTDEAQTVYLGSPSFSDPIVSIKENIAHGYTNSADWAALTGLTVQSLPFPPTDLHSLESALEADAAALIGTSAAASGGMLHSWSEKHAYDPGDGLGIKALDGGTSSHVSDGPYSAVQLGQCHQARVVSYDPDNTLPPFFGSGFGTVWVDAPWGGDRWQPAGAGSMSFGAMVGAALTTAGVVEYAGPMPANPPDQAFTVYARQTTHPLGLDAAGAIPGTIQDTSDLAVVASFTVSFDFGSNSYVAPSTIDLDLSSVPLTSDGSAEWGIELIIEPDAWHGDINVVDVLDPDAAAVPNNSAVSNTSHYGFDCLLASLDIPWSIHFPSFRYWVPGSLGPATPIGGYWGVLAA